MVDVEHPQENDFILAIADHLNAEPTLCACGHPSVLHADVGCLTSPANDGVLCPCRASGRDANGRPPCRCGHMLADHAPRVGCTARWVHDSGGDVCPCEGDGTAEPEPLVLSDKERHLILLIRRDQARRDAADGEGEG